MKKPPPPSFKKKIWIVLTFNFQWQIKNNATLNWNINLFSWLILQKYVNKVFRLIKSMKHIKRIMRKICKEKHIFYCKEKSLSGVRCKNAVIKSELLIVINLLFIKWFVPSIFFFISAFFLLWVVSFHICFFLRQFVSLFLYNF